MKLDFRRTAASTLLACAATAAVFAAQPAFAQADPVVLSFSTVGDSRLDPAKDDSTQKPLNAQDFEWLQNTKAWSRIMREIGAKKSSLLFFNGDMIMGYGNASLPAALPATVTDYMNTDLARYYTQSAYWRGMVAPMIETGTYIVPVPGNHEVQCRNGQVKVPAGLATGVTAGTVWGNISCTDINGGAHGVTDPQVKVGMKVNEDAWRANFGDLIVDNTRLNAILAPKGLSVSNVTGTSAATAPGSADLLTTDQSKLSYSFDVGTSHFVVINTDPAGRDTTAPNAWLAADMSAAQTRGARNFFVFGHKPAFTYVTNGIAPGSGLDADPTNTANRDAFWSIIEQYGAVYFCGHEHVYNVMQPTKATGGSAYQVLVGSGGSAFDNAAALAAGQPVTDRYYAWANVKILQSGKVSIEAYGFSDTYGPTQLLNVINLAH
jgi:hypothetical protein